MIVTYEIMFQTMKFFKELQ